MMQMFQKTRQAKRVPAFCRCDIFVFVLTAVTAATKTFQTNCACDNFLIIVTAFAIATVTMVVKSVGCSNADIRRFSNVWNRTRIFVSDATDDTVTPCGRAQLEIPVTRVW